MTEESDIDIEFENKNDKISKKEDSSSYSDPTPESDKYSESDSEEEIVSEKSQHGDTVERERSSNLENGLDDKEVGELVEIGNIKNLKFREQKFENINWQSDTLKELEFELEKYRIKQLENSPSWKVQKYLKIISIQNNINKQKRYLKWKGSTSIL
ncbi:hypothetical protein M0812_24286 [Anaeramoeba flamelloides]|uniref:Uncharacterized protein n=1 Tax=Anaeramoeba flamelloides TaxID=1746091 RepID=A0AAV7YJZ0_9EUKA|nr:hypothetical protein M0812_24286 [Anaeramoeba flamelloides]